VTTASSLRLGAYFRIITTSSHIRRLTHRMLPAYPICSYRFKIDRVEVADDFEPAREW
jgi:hypothetical protein